MNQLKLKLIEVWNGDITSAELLQFIFGSVNFTTGVVTLATGNFYLYPIQYLLSIPLIFLGGLVYLCVFGVIKNKLSFIIDIASFGTILYGISQLFMNIGLKQFGTSAMVVFIFLYFWMCKLRRMQRVN